MKFSFVVFLILQNANLEVVFGKENSAVDLLQDIYYECLRDFSVSCAKPKALQWITDVSDKDEIKITEDLLIVKKVNLEEELEVSFTEFFWYLDC